jgi:hypothetical protein
LKEEMTGFLGREISFTDTIDEAEFLDYLEC